MADWHKVDASEIRLQLARMLESDDLRRAGTLSELLKFFVEERIAFGDRPITQRRLAEEVLGKDEGFTPTSNAHVRIYLRRLRQRIAAYYAGAGASDPIVLGVTVGPYRLSVKLRESAPRPTGHDGRHGKVPGTKAARRKVKQAAVVLTSELASAGLDGDLQLLPTLVPRALARYLLGKDGLVAIGPVPREQLSDRPCESPVALTSAAEYLLEGSVDVGPFQSDGKRPLEIVVRLHEIESGKHLWSRSCKETMDPRDLVSAAEMVAARLAATILAAKG
jgi:hypothetical protein